MRTRLVPLVIVAIILLVLSGWSSYLAASLDGFTLEAFDFGESPLWWMGLLLLFAGVVMWVYVLETIVVERWS